MKGIYLGIELGDSFCQAAWYNEDKKIPEPIPFSEKYKFPLALGKLKGENKWYIGEEAIKEHKKGRVVLIEKLFLILKGKDQVNVDGKKFRSEDLMKIYMARFMSMILKKLNKDGILRLTFCIESTQANITDYLVQISEGLGIARECVQVINYKEAFLFFALSQSQENRRNKSCLFELSNKGLEYYEFNVIRGRKPQPVTVSYSRLEKKFDVGLLKKASFQKTTDELLLEYAKKLFNKKLISSVYLSGSGFEDASWCKDFTNFICRGKKVFIGEALYAQGGAANSQMGNQPPYLCLCDGRVLSTVSMKAIQKEKEYQVVLIKAGTNWYDARSNVELLLENDEDIEIKVETYGRRLDRTYRIACPKVEDRPPKTTRVELTTVFLEDNYMLVKVKDLGFGELYPSTGKEERKYIRL